MWFCITLHSCANNVFRTPARRIALAFCSNFSTHRWHAFALFGPCTPLKIIVNVSLRQSFDMAADSIFCRTASAAASLLPLTLIMWSIFAESANTHIQLSILWSKTTPVIEPTSISMHIQNANENCIQIAYLHNALPANRFFAFRSYGHIDAS